MSFLKSILSQSRKYEDPFQHWELNQPLTEEQLNEIVNAEIANPTEHNLNYDGTRAIDGGEGNFRRPRWVWRMQRLFLIWCSGLLYSPGPTRM